MTTPTGSTLSAGRFRWGWWVAVIFALQGTGLWWLSRKASAPQPSANPAPLLLANTNSAGLLEALALEDPTAFAQPNPRGFSGPSLRPGMMPHQPYRWQPPEIEIPYPTNLLTGPIDSILKTNLGNSANAFIKPNPEIMVLNVPPLDLPKTSRLEVAGDLAGRKLITPPKLKTWNHTSLLRPTRVQVMVNPSGRVFSVVRLGGSGHAPADAMALALARRSFQFSKTTNAPAAPLDLSRFTTGDLIFHWHTNPLTVTNLVEEPRRE
jgi:hypothetical protein